MGSDKDDKPHHHHHHHKHHKQKHHKKHRGECAPKNFLKNIRKMIDEVAPGAFYDCFE